MVCVDTNFLIEFVEQTADIKKFIEKMSINGTKISTTIASIAELYYGAYNSNKIQVNIIKVKKIASSFLILDIDANSAEQYGKIFTELRHNGTPIGVMDTIIASIVVANNETLVTKDSDFDNISYLKTTKW